MIIGNGRIRKSVRLKMGECLNIQRKVDPSYRRKRGIEFRNNHITIRYVWRWRRTFLDLGRIPELNHQLSFVTLVSRVRFIACLVNKIAGSRADTVRASRSGDKAGFCFSLCQRR
jgi:hypothetical protein